MSIASAIIYKADLVDYISGYTELHNEGGSYRGACPIHKGDSGRSLKITGKKYHCFVCGSGGSIINFVADMNKIRYDTAVIKLATELNIDSSIDKDFQRVKNQVELNEEEMSMYQQDVDKIMEYLTVKRGLSAETISDFALGYKPGGIVIPLRDRHGRVVAFATRQLASEPKYINSYNNELYDKSAFFYNLDRAQRKIQDRLYLVEGYFDAMAADQQGLPCVAYCGITLSKEHIEILGDLATDHQNLTVVFCPDNDDKAYKEIEKVRNKLLQYAPNINVEVGTINLDYKDFCDLNVAGMDIASSLSTESIDMYVLRTKLLAASNVNAEYTIAEQYMKSVRNYMVKLDLIDWLADRWSRKAEDLRQWFKISEEKNIDDYIEAFKDFDSGISECKELFDSGYITFGYPNLDAETRGGRRGEVVISAAYAGVAKTHWAVNVALHMVVREKKNVIFFSLEMTAGALYERIIANLLGKSPLQIEQMIKACDPLIYQLKDALGKRLLVVDKNNLSISEIRKYIEIANTRIFENGTDCVIIDYLQYMKGTKNYEEISETARELKAVAKDYYMVVIALSQLSRQGSPWIKPTLQMLKGSGDIEASADIIFGLWRPYLNPALSAADKDNPQLRKQVLLGILKFRRGSISIDEFELEFAQGGKLREVI